MIAAEYILALDVGDKRIGVAITHQLARLPHPLTTLENSETIFDDVQRLVTREHAGAVVVGLPRGMDGGYTAQTRSAEAFKQELDKALTVPVYLADETLTSIQAETALKGKPHSKGDIDALAACYILDSFLREHPEVLTA